MIASKSRRFSVTEIEVVQSIGGVSLPLNRITAVLGTTRTQRFLNPATSLCQSVIIIAAMAERFIIFPVGELSDNDAVIIGAIVFTPTVMMNRFTTPRATKALGGVVSAGWMYALIVAVGVFTLIVAVGMLAMIVAVGVLAMFTTSAGTAMLTAAGA
ncbi:MAG: hypothetical protein U1F68_08050 [Gammaproteobacteria bacterium]